MFTGIVEELGEVAAVEELGSARRLSVTGSAALVDGARRGDSYAVNGVCLTVTGWGLADGRATLSFDVMAESLRRSALGALVAGDPVNLERPVRLADRLGGHLVQGHADGVGTVLERLPDPNWEVVRISLPDGLARYLVPQGSITVDGTSLTVVDAAADSFTVSLIPETLARTTLGRKGPGSPVNLEVDVLAKYVERLLAARA